MQLILDLSAYEIKSESKKKDNSLPEYIFTNSFTYSARDHMKRR
jgi:hypothetical protein